MKFESPRELLLDAILSVEKVAGKNMALPVLGCILIDAKKEGVRLSATNLEIGIERVIRAKVTQEGVVAVPASILSSTIANARGTTPVSLEATETTLTVSADGGAATIKRIPEDDFPSLPRPTADASVSLPGSGVSRAIRAVSHCASSSTIKPELSSVMLTVRDGGLVAVATDSFRLAEKIIPLKSPVSLSTILIPAKGASDVARVAEESGNDDVAIRMDEHQLSLESSGGYLTSRLIEGSFPDYQKIIPKEFVTEFTALKGDVLHILRKAAVFSDKFNQVTLTVDPKAGTVAVHAQNPDVGDVQESLSASITGEAVSISFNLRYLVDAFGPIAEDSIVFSLSGAGRPMVIRGAGDASYTYLVMPMNR